MNQVKLYKLNQVTKNPINFIFKALSQLSVPWSTDSTLLDIEYLSRSGNKIVTPLVDSMIELNADKQLTDEQITLLAKIIQAKFGKTWNKLYATTTAEYNPINNYDMTETETTNNKSITDITDSVVGTQTTDTTDTLNKNNTTTTSGSDNTSKFGFNTSTAVPTDLSNAQSTQESNDTATNTNKQSNNSKTDTTTNNTMNNDIKRELKRSGNIGVTTTQQMLESERQLNMWIFFDHVYQDVDSVLTEQTYWGCTI